MSPTSYQTAPPRTMTEILFSFQCCDVGYEPGELPDCSTPQCMFAALLALLRQAAKKNTTQLRTSAQVRIFRSRRLHNHQSDAEGMGAGARGLEGAGRAGGSGARRRLFSAGGASWALVTIVETAAGEKSLPRSRMRTSTPRGSRRRPCRPWAGSTAWSGP